MDADALADMVARDRAEWQKLVVLLDAQPGTPVHGPGSPDWNARDVYAHFARWLGHSTDDFEATLAGRGRPQLEGTDDEINARWQQEDAALSFHDARGLAQRAFDRRIELLQSTPADRWNPPRRHRPRRRPRAHRRAPPLHRVIQGVARLWAPGV